jgi:hypothetical protein
MYTVRQPKGPVARAAAVLSLGCAALLVGPPSAPAEAPFVAGSGVAFATVGRVVARASGLPMTTTYGGALAHYQGISARAEAATVDLGVLGVLLTTPTGCGRAPLSPDQLPKRTVADSHGGAVSASKDVAGTGPVGAGREEAAARPGARAEAGYASAALELGDLLTSGEGRTASRAELVEGRERRASAEVRVGRVDVAGGLVSLRGLRWTAEHRSGAGGLVLGADGSFGLDGIVVAGVPLPVSTPLELASAFDGANRLIAPFGLRLEPPRTATSTGQREVRVTPLRLVVGDGTAARPLIAPLMNGLQPAREALLAAMKGPGSGGCNPGAAGGLAFTVADVAAAALDGGGGVDLELGGVLATTEGVDYGDPFGLIPPGLPATAPAVVGPARRRAPAPAAPADERVEYSPAPVPAAATARPAAAESAAPVAAAPGPSPAQSMGPARSATRRCESSSRGRPAGCSNGAPLPASAAALAAALALFGADWWRVGRRAIKEVPR